MQRGGGAEQYHANTKYAVAVAVAAEACADDTKGQTCYICTEAVHRHTKEGWLERHDDAAAAFLERVNGTATVLGEDDAILISDDVACGTMGCGGL